MIEVRIKVPAIAAEKHETELMRRACRIFGGATLDAAVHTGAWQDPTDGALFLEPTRDLVVAVDSLLGLATVAAFAREVGTLLAERAVYVSALGVSEIVRVSR